MTTDVAADEIASCAPLGASRTRVLEELQAAVEPVGVSDIAERVALHVNTARFHLDALAAAGLVERCEEQAHRAGRPRILYRATPDSPATGQRSYRLLAEILTGHLAAHSRRPAETARAAGVEWGRCLAPRAAPFHRVTAAEATRQLCATLTDIGFAPQPVTTGRATQVRLTHCPFREVAVDHQQIVCSVHFGLIQGLLDEIDAPIEAHDIEPFAEPAACLVHLRRRPSGSPLSS